MSLGKQLLLHVYQPKQGQSFPGFGIYHTGIQISDQRDEYCFAGGPYPGSGVSVQTPKVAPSGSQWQFYQTVILGPIKLTDEQIKRNIEHLRSSFPAKSYHVTGNNCNHFTEAFHKVMKAPVPYPAWVNRAAKMGHSMQGLGSQTPSVEAPKTVFESTQGYSLGGPEKPAPPSQRGSFFGGSKSTAPAQPSAKPKRHNPWADPDFVKKKLEKNNKPVAK